MYKEAKKCRLCGGGEISVLNLGIQYLTGVFPLPHEADTLEKGPLELVRCENCGLVQLRHSFAAEKMYGDNYGYHSSLNPSMVRHLGEIVDECMSQAELAEGDLIVDIGSNDGTSLGLWQSKARGIQLDLLGMDPTGMKFKKYYKEGICLIPDFFSAKSLLDARPGKLAKVVSSIAMFYDLEDPVDFAKQVASVLAENGLWVMEQCYLPLLLRTNGYDTICHEHLEFYTLRNIDYIAKAAGLKVVKVSTNDTNGGSFRVLLAHAASGRTADGSVARLMAQEERELADPEACFGSFMQRVEKHRQDLKTFLEEAARQGKLVLGYGASTKGNVVLQYCQIGPELLPAIAEVNEDKFGHVTPGTGIKIISEEEARSMHPDYFLVMPWHFKESILQREQAYRMETGTKFVFYLPELEIY